MPTFGLTDIKQVIFQCKRCNHDSPIEIGSTAQAIMIPQRCSNPNCPEVWVHPAVGFPFIHWTVEEMWDVQAYGMFLSLLPAIRVAEARMENTERERIVPFRIRFEFAETAT